MFRTILQNKTKIAFVVILIVGMTWYVLSSSTATAPDPSLVTSETSVNSVDQDVVSTLLKLRAIHLNISILSDPSFIALRDFSTPIVPEPVGRQDPFAPLSTLIRQTVGAAGAKDAAIFKKSH